MRSTARSSASPTGSTAGCSPAAGVLAGDGVFTVRARVRQTDPNLDRNPETAKRF